MKRRISAILLALGLSASVLSMGVYAAETETELVTEAVAGDEAAAAEDALDEGESELEDALEADAETAETTSPEDQVKSYLSSTLSQISAWSDEEIDMIIEGDDSSSAAIAANWKSVKEELGAFEDVLSAELSEDGSSITGLAKYEKIDEKTDVEVTYSVDQKAGTFKVEWNINYPLSVNLQRAGMNTLMGLAIVFIVLIFLSWLIGKLHIIPDMIENKNKAKAPAPAPAAAPAAPVAAPAVEEELTDDLELVAVITAAIAASENTSSDGFVVRSIKKSNKRNWQRA